MSSQGHGVQDVVAFAHALIREPAGVQEHGEDRAALADRGEESADRDVAVVVLDAVLNEMGRPAVDLEGAVQRFRAGSRLREEVL